MGDNRTGRTTVIDGKTVTLEELQQRFPPLENDDKEKYSGKCDYCNIEIVFSDPMQVKIIINDTKEGIGKFSIYHAGCHERYLRRTID